MLGSTNVGALVFCRNFDKRCPISTKICMRDLTLKWNNLSMYGEFAIYISVFNASFYSCTPQFVIYKPIQCLVLMIISQVIDKKDTKCEGLPPCLWDQGTERKNNSLYSVYVTDCSKFN